MLCFWTILAVLHLTGSISADISNEISNNYTSSDKFLSNLMRDCKTPTVACVQKNVYHYFDEILQSKDVNFGFLNFTKNSVKYEKGDADEDEEESRSSPIEEVAGALREKATEFVYTHDLKVTLPDFLFGGGVLQISPRGMDGSGAMLRVDVQPKEEPSTAVANPRLFKKIKKFFSSKLLMALGAIILVVKLLAMKFMFFLPTIMGVAAAKKLLLKIMLFVFPFLSHLFKLCPYYSPTKYHHHHHQISHLHNVGGHGHIHGHGHHLPSIELDHPPPGWKDHHEHHVPHHELDDNLGYYSDGPSFGPGFASHRKDYEPPRQNTVRREEGNSISYQSGQGQTGVGHQGGPHKAEKSKSSAPFTPTEIENMVLKAEKEAMLKARLQEEQKRVEIENKRLQDQIKTALKLQDKLRIQSLVNKQAQKIAAAYQPSNVLQPQNVIQPQVIQPHIVHAVPAASIHGQTYLSQPVMHHVPQTQSVYHQNVIHHVTPSAPVYQAPVTPAPLPIYDSFYSPILNKIDKVLVELGFHDEGCRERLICSMYKNPTKFSPHSNLISAELSRDANELQKPTSSNQAVVRFYKYVQAARDGQDKRDCLRLYPTCAIITE